MRQNNQQQIDKSKTPFLPLPNQVPQPMLFQPQLTQSLPNSQAQTPPGLCYSNLNQQIPNEQNSLNQNYAYQNNAHQQNIPMPMSDSHLQNQQAFQPQQQYFYQQNQSAYPNISAHTGFFQLNQQQQQQQQQNPLQFQGDFLPQVPQQFGQNLPQNFIPHPFQHQQFVQTTNEISENVDDKVQQLPSQDQLSKNQQLELKLNKSNTKLIPLFPNDPYGDFEFKINGKIYVLQKHLLSFYSDYFKGLCNPKYCLSSIGINRDFNNEHIHNILSLFYGQVIQVKREQIPSYQCIIDFVKLKNLIIKICQGDYSSQQLTQQLQINDQVSQQQIEELENKKKKLQQQQELELESKDQQLKEQKKQLEEQKLNLQKQKELQKLEQQKKKQQQKLEELKKQQQIDEQKQNLQKEKEQLKKKQQQQLEEQKKQLEEQRKQKQKEQEKLKNQQKIDEFKKKKEQKIQQQNKETLQKQAYFLKQQNQTQNSNHQSRNSDTLRQNQPIQQRNSNRQQQQQIQSRPRQANQFISNQNDYPMWEEDLAEIEKEQQKIQDNDNNLLLKNDWYTLIKLEENQKIQIEKIITEDLKCDLSKTKPVFNINANSKSENFSNLQKAMKKKASYIFLIQNLCADQNNNKLFGFVTKKSPNSKFTHDDSMFLFSFDLKTKEFRKFTQKNSKPFQNGGHNQDEEEEEKQQNQQQQKEEDENQKQNQQENQQENSQKNNPNNYTYRISENYIIIGSRQEIIIPENPYQNQTYCSLSGLFACQDFPRNNNEKQIEALTGEQYFFIDNFLVLKCSV